MSAILLCHFNGTDASIDFIDNGFHELALTAYSAAEISTADFVLGDASGLFQNTINTRVEGTYSTTINLTDLTIAFRFIVYSFKTNPSNDAAARLLVLKSAAGNHIRILLNDINNDGTGNLFITATNTADDSAFSTETSNPIAIQLDTWYAVRFEIYGNTLYSYLNGIKQGTQETSAIYRDIYAVVMGGEASGDFNLAMNGRLDELLIDDTSLLIGAASYPVEIVEFSSLYNYTDIIKMYTVGTDIEFDLNFTEAVNLSTAFPETHDYENEIDVSFSINNGYESYVGLENVEIVNVGFQINSSYSYEVYIPPNWIQRNFIARIGDLPLPMASFNATLSASGSSYVSLQIPALTSALLDEIIARQTDPIIISRSHVYSDGSVKEREFIHVNYDNISSDTGPKSGTTITLSGRKYIPVAQSKEVIQTEVYYRNFSQGKARYRIPVNDEINLGDKLIIDNTDFIVGKITYYISTSNEFMECQEYIADGTDSIGIGSNIRPVPLQAYLVAETHPNYFLWQAQGYLFNGRAMNPADFTNYAYNLWYDGAGLLWYAENFPVYEPDGITQANVNI